MTRKLFWVVLAMMMTAELAAGVRTVGESGGQMTAKLQAMVRQVSKERDTLQAENAQLKMDLEQSSKQHTSLETELAETEKKLFAQRSLAKNLSQRQQQTLAKLEEIIAKYKDLRQQRNALQVNYDQQGLQLDQTRQALDTCSGHNDQLIDAAHELLERYQNKGTLSGLLQSEPVFQFESVDMENLVQDYEDRIRDEKFTQNADSQN